MISSLNGGRRAESRRAGGASLLPNGRLLGLVVVTLAVGLLLGRTLWSQRTPTPSASETIEQAEAILIEALRTDDTETYNHAYGLFTAVLSQEPARFEALRGAAIADLGLHRFATANERAERAHELRPADHITLAALVDANIELGQYSTAEDWLDELLSVRPGLAAYTRLSYFRQLTGDHDGAIEAMFLARSAADGLGPESARVDALLGELYFEAGDWEQALDFYWRASDADPIRVDATVGAARIAFLRGDTSSALSVVDDVLAVDPENVSALMLGAEIHRTSDDDSRADEMAEAATRIAFSEMERGFGTDPSAALFASTWGDPAKGLELVESMTAARPLNIKVAHAHAWALHQIGRTDEALPRLEVALQFETIDPVLHRHAALIFAAGGDQQQSDAHELLADSGP